MIKILEKKNWEQMEDTTTKYEDEENDPMDHIDGLSKKEDIKQ